MQKVIPLITAASANLWQASNHGMDYTKLTEANKFDAIRPLNYLESVTIGIFQNIYVEQMARDYLQEIVRKAVKALICISSTIHEVDKRYLQRVSYGVL